jgi:GT2 family glycosyltransferase
MIITDQEYPLVSVIIPNYNGKQFIESCLRTVLSTDYPRFEIIVVDDGSTDNSAELVKEKFGQDNRVRLIRQNNKGAAAAKNTGAKVATGDIFCFLDNDAEVESSWLKNLVKVLISEDKIGAAQSLILDFKNRNTIQVAGVKIIPYLGLAVPIMQGNNIHKIKLDQIEICGLSAALAVKKHVFFEVGGFDEHLAKYTEDLDFSWRIWLKGYKILLAPHSIVYHWTKPPKMRISAGFSSYDFNFHLTKNSMRFVLKNSDSLELLPYLLLNLFFHCARIFLLIEKRDFPAVIGILRGFLWNFVNLRDTFIERSKIQRVLAKVKVPSSYGFPLRRDSLCR